MGSVTRRHLYRSEKIKRASPDLRPLMIAAWVKRCRHRCVTFTTFTRVVYPFIKSAPHWYEDLERLWESAVPK